MPFHFSPPLRRFVFRDTRRREKAWKESSIPVIFSSILNSRHVLSVYSYLIEHSLLKALRFAVGFPHR